MITSITLTSSVHLKASGDYLKMGALSYSFTAYHYVTLSCRSHIYLYRERDRDEMNLKTSYH